MTIAFPDCILKTIESCHWVYGYLLRFKGYLAQETDNKVLVPKVNEGVKTDVKS